MPKEYRILIVEDSETVAGLVQGMLEDLFYTEWVERAADGLQRVVAAPIIDLVLLDLLLENGSGKELVSRFKEASPQTPIIVMTGFDYTESEMIDAGACAYFRKGENLNAPAIFDAAIKAIAANKADEQVAPLEQHIEKLKEELKASSLVEGAGAPILSSAAPVPLPVVIVPSEAPLPVEVVPKAEPMPVEVVPHSSSPSPSNLLHQKGDPKMAKPKPDPVDPKPEPKPEPKPGK